MSEREGRVSGISPSRLKSPSTTSAESTIVTNISAVIRSAYSRP
jgi:hypothetical protein